MLLLLLQLAKFKLSPNLLLQPDLFKPLGLLYLPQLFIPQFLLFLFLSLFPSCFQLQLFGLPPLLVLPELLFFCSFLQPEQKIGEDSL